MRQLRTNVVHGRTLHREGKKLKAPAKHYIWSSQRTDRRTDRLNDGKPDALTSLLWRRLLANFLWLPSAIYQSGAIPPLTSPPPFLTSPPLPLLTSPPPAFPMSPPPTLLKSPLLTLLMFPPSLLTPTYDHSTRNFFHYYRHH